MYTERMSVILIKNVTLIKKCYATFADHIGEENLTHFKTYLAQDYCHLDY
jgi:hypothetical protein